MRDRLNIRLTVAVLAVAVVAAGAVALVHSWQFRRNADGLIQLADEAEVKGNSDRVLRLLATYLDLVPRDAAVRARYGTVAESLARDEKGRARVATVYERVLNEAPDRADVRLRLARLYVSNGQHREALAHFEALGTADAEAVGGAAACHESLGNAAEAVRLYRLAVDLDPNQVARHVKLVVLLRSAPGSSNAAKAKSVAEADAAIERLVAANPNSASAHLARGRYRMEFRTGDPTTDFAAAVRLAPQDAEVRLAAAALAQTPAAAREHLRAALEHHKGDERLHLALSAVEAQTGNRTEAVAVLRRALTLLPGNSNILFALADRAVTIGDLPEAERTLAEIGRWKLSPERVALLRARVRMAAGDWRSARTTVEAVRPALTASTAKLAAEADVLLGRCHEQLGESDLALAAFRRAASGDPTRPDAPAGVARSLVALGRLGEAVDHYRRLTAAPNASVEIWLTLARLRAVEYLSAPPAARRSGDLDAVLAQAAERVPNAAELLLIRAEILSADRKPDEAERLLRDALARTPGAADIALPLARLLVRHGKVADAWAVLDESEKAAGATVALRVARLEMLPKGEDDRSRVVFRAAEGAFTQAGGEEDRIKLATALASSNARAERPAEVRRWLGEIARIRPYDLGVQLRLFEAVVAGGERTQIEEAVREIHRVEGGSGPLGHYAEAVLRFARPQDRTPSSLHEAQQHLASAALLRPTWAIVPSARAVLAELGGKSDEALKEYLRAIDLGERRVVVVRRAVQLLFARRRYPEAVSLLQRLRPESDPSGQLLKLEAELLLFNLQLDRAAELAGGLVPVESKRYEDHLWQAEILAAAGRNDEALAAFRRAIDVAGPHGAPWVALVRHHVRAGRRKTAEDILSELRGRLTGAELALAAAQSHEILGQGEQAERAYQSAVDARPEDVEALRQLFAFYLRRGTPAKATPALRRALVPRPLIPANEIAWAKRSLAIALATSGDYAAFLDAVRLADEALAAVPEGPDELLAKARVLATRLGHRREAIQLLQRLRSRRTLLEPAEEFLLGQLVADAGPWTEGRGILLNLLAREGDNPIYLRFFVDRLLRHGPLGDAEAWLARLEEVAPNDVVTASLRATLLVKRGDFKAASDHLSRAAVTKPGAEPDRGRLRAVARAADELGREGDAASALWPVAEALYREAAKGGSAEDRLALVVFLARQGKVDGAVATVQGVDGVEPLVVAATLVAAAYSSPALTDSQLGTLETEIKERLEHAKPPSAVASLTGLVHARRGRYSDAVRSFRAVVAAGETAESLNNLAYMLVLSETGLGEVEGLLNRSLALGGLTAELLDTRGMAHLTAGRTGEAIADLERAVDQNPSAVKCLHLALAYQKAGRVKDAAALLARSKELQADGGLVLPAEGEVLKRLNREVKAPR